MIPFFFSWRDFGMYSTFYCNCNYCNFSHFAMSRLYLEKIWKNLNRGVHFCLFLPLCLLITSDLRCVHLPLNLSFHRCTLRGVGCTLRYLLTVSMLLYKNRGSAPLSPKTSTKNAVVISTLQIVLLLATNGNIVTVTKHTHRESYFIMLIILINKIY